MSAGNSPNPSWPDPAEWANRLHKEMADRQADYEGETDVSLKRNKAGGMLKLLITSLREWPAFWHDPVHWPLKDLLIFLSDLERGRDHPWAATVSVGGTNITTTSQDERKKWVRAAYGILKDCGWKPVAAYSRIASGLTSSGRTGRGGKPVRWQRVQAWCLEAETPSHQHAREKLQLLWEVFRAECARVKVLDARGSPAPMREIAGLFVDGFWSSPHLRDRSVSGG